MSDSSSWTDLFTNHRWSFSSTSPTEDTSIVKARSFDRPGKFDSLWDFLEVDEQDKSLLERYRYEQLGTINAQPGCIVHILDQGDESARFDWGAGGSRLHRRVMLVLRRSSMSFLCLTFCSHRQQQNTQDHWAVCDEGHAAELARTSRLKPLEIKLHPNGLGTPSPTVTMKKSITVNIEDIWNVENEVFVRVLGEVAPGSLRGLVEAVMHRFVQKLDVAVPRSGESSERMLRAGSNEGRPAGNNWLQRAVDIGPRTIGGVQERPARRDDVRRVVTIEEPLADNNHGRSTRRDDGHGQRRTAGYYVSHGSSRRARERE